MSINKIKEELQSINRRNTAFNYIVQDPNIAKLTKALSVAVDFIDLCTPNKDGEMCQEHLGDVANDAYWAARNITNVLFSEEV